MSKLSFTPQTSLVQKASQNDASKPTVALKQTLKAQRYNYLMDTPQEAAQRFVDEVIGPIVYVLEKFKYDEEGAFQYLRLSEKRRMQVMGKYFYPSVPNTAESVFQALTGGISFEEVWNREGSNQGTVIFDNRVLIVPYHSGEFQTAIDETMRLKGYDMLIQIEGWQEGIKTRDSKGKQIHKFGFLEIKPLERSSKKVYYGFLAANHKIIHVLPPEKRQEILQMISHIAQYAHHDCYHGLVTMQGKRIPKGLKANGKETYTVSGISESEYNALKFSHDFLQRIYAVNPELLIMHIKNFDRFIALCAGIQDNKVRHYYLSWYAYHFGRVVNPHTYHEQITHILEQFPDLFNLTTPEGANESEIAEVVAENAFAFQLSNKKTLTHEEFFARLHKATPASRLARMNELLNGSDDVEKIINVTQIIEGELDESLPD